MLKLTTRARYSVQALLDLSLQPSAQPVSVSAIAKRQDLPASYLEKLLIELRRAGIVRSVRGAHGGYVLARNANKISLGEVLEAVGETMLLAAPSQSANPQAEDWVTYSLWRRLNLKLRDALYGISLEDLYFDARSWQAAQGMEEHFII